MTKGASNAFNFRSLGLIPYLKGLKIQQNYVDLVQMGKLKGIILFCEHYPVYTFGRRQTIDKSLSNIADVVKIQRGGQTTYHGPGQICIYPIINLKDINMGIRDYVYSLESIVIKFLSLYGVIGYRSTSNGVFHENKKISSVGVHVQRFVTCHGISININNTTLPWFNRIVPCGLSNVEMATLQSINNQKYASSTLIPHLKTTFEQEWDIKLIKTQ